LLFVFDIDSTLTPPRQPMEPGFADGFLAFCRAHKVYLVSGSDRGKIDAQVPARVIEACAGLFTSAGSEYESGGKVIYHHDHEFPDELVDALAELVERSAYPVRMGRHIEYRTGSLNASSVGRNAGRAERHAYLVWDQAHNERARMCREIERRFPDYEATIGGEISIDVSPVGWNKSRVMIILEHNHGNEPVTFVGDAIYPGGNDWPLAQALQATSPDNVIVPVADHLQTAEWLSRFERAQPAIRTA
jgi:phosphomannomutase